ncbi:MAG: UDP-N-acetylglucosamine 2-epimerase (non-hydrolyzing) [Myxococcales bacterium]|nr:UDP-N-acetylglucosamine 2-epimerase (non-hydrolyzing) [Myxococcales bacterium]
MSKKKLMFVVGTRPEAIKMAPVILRAADDPRFEPLLVTTSQHREMLDQMLAVFGLTPAVDLDIMRHDQSLADVTTAALRGLDRAVADLAPDVVLVQGDTTTTFCGALAGFYHQVPVAHIEAGLRTFDKRQPFPEEVNRCLTTQVTEFHFPPTDRSLQNLLREGVREDRCWVTGNTAIDALFWTLDRAKRDGRLEAPTGRTLLVTAHRRENHGAPMERICNAVLRLVERFDDLEVEFPVHMSPRVRSVVMPKLGDHPRIRLIDPLDYEDFVLAMHRAELILTDSGGVQEEAPSLGKPVLVLRETTERPEAADAGVARLVGADEEKIVAEASRLLSDRTAYEAMARAMNPYGDGHAAGRILEPLA